MSMPSIGGVAQSVSLREASLDDYEQIVSVEKQSALGTRSREDWRHFWLDNPEYRRHAHWPIGWVLENREGCVVGSICNIPLAYEYQGRRVVAATGRGWSVDPAYRTYACLLLEELLCQENVDLILNTTVNQHAAEAYQTFQSPRVPQGNWDRSAFWITNYRGFVKIVAAAKQWKGGPFLVEAGAAALRLKGALKGSSLPRANNQVVKLEAGFDERFDVFWEELRRRNPNLLLAVRSREALEWHFRYYFQKKRLYILTVSELDRIVGYSIFARKDDEEHGLKRIRFIDHQSISDSGTLASMLAWMLHTCRKEGIHMLEDVGCCIDEVTAPHYRKLSSWLFYYKASGAIAEKLLNPASWRTSLFDGDSSL